MSDHSFPSRVQLIALASDRGGDWQGCVSLRILEETLLDFLQDDKNFLKDRLNSDADWIPESLKVFFTIALAESQSV